MGFITLGPARNPDIDPAESRPGNALDLPPADAAIPPPAQPPSDLGPNPGFWRQTYSLGEYLMQTQVHTYAFSVAANAILSLFPFIVVLMSLSRNVFHSTAMQQGVANMLRNILPVGQDFVVRNMLVLAKAHKTTTVFSIVMLIISSSGVFLPLEVALNQVWRVASNRSYLKNQLISLALAFAVGLLALGSVALTSSPHPLATVAPAPVAAAGSEWLLRIIAAAASCLLFFLIYWILPNRRVPALAVLPSAVITGLLWELAKRLYILVLPYMDLQSVYGPFSISVSLIIWAYCTGLLLLGGAHYSANRHAIRQARLDEIARASEA